MLDLLLDAASWALVQAMAPAIGLPIPPPPCPEPSADFPESLVYFAVNLARTLVWNEPCPMPV